MDKPVFVDFGCGPNVKQLLKYRKKGYYVIMVDRSEEDLYENTDIQDIEYYKLIADEISFFDITDISKRTTYKADVWNCAAVLEHIEPDQVDLFLTGIKNSCKKGSRGSMYIDLTDHFGGFDHRVNPEKYSHFIKNIYTESDWYDIIEKHFEIKKWYRRIKSDITPDDPTFVRTLKNKWQKYSSHNCFSVLFILNT